MAAARILALVVFSAATAAAQHYAHLYGRILDESAAGVGDATVTVTNQDSGFRRTAQSELLGTYSISSLLPGLYKIDVRKDGFRPAVSFGVDLVAGASTRADFSLSIGSIGQSIIVVGAAPLINHDDASTGSRFDREEIQRLPLNGRGLLTLLELVPGTNVTPATRGEAGQFTTSGQRPNSNYFTVDGVSANTGVTAGGLPAQFTGGALPALSAFGSLDSLISIEAVDEFRVQTSTEVAEFGRLPGASISLTSRSGSNQFHGSAAGRWRDESLGANDWFGNQAGYGRLPLRLLDADLALGGPLKRNRTFFFLSYERTELTQPYVWAQAVPSLDARQSAPSWAGPALSLFPLPNNGALTGQIGEWIGRTTRPAALHAGGARFDHAITSRLALFGRYNDSPSTNQFGSFQVNALDFRFQSLTLGLTARPTANLAVDARVNASKAGADSVWTQGAGSPGCELASLAGIFETSPSPCDYLVRFSISGIGQLVSGREGARRQRQIQAIESATWRHGGHSLAVGADYRDILAVRRDVEPTLSVIADSLQDLTNTNRLWIARADPLRPSTDVKELSLWIQDTWQATPRLTIAAGLRWEFSPAPLSKAQTDPSVPEDATWFLDPVTNAIVTYPTPRPLWPESLDNFAPRLGVAWRLTGSGRTMLRAGAGLYYDSSVSIATDVLNGGPLNLSLLKSSIYAPFSTFFSFGFQENLHLPKVVEWNVSVDRALGTHDVASVSYVGSAGLNLIRRELGGAGNSPTVWLAITTNRGSSDYHALQLEYHRRVATGLQAVASYAWSHALDTGSSDSYLAWAGPGTSAALDHASSDFDLRHSLTASLSYEFPLRTAARAPLRLLGGWGIDTVFHARSGFPLTVLESDEFRGIALSNAFRPHLVSGVPVWIRDPAVPGGRRLNPAAFVYVNDGTQGTLGRNVLSGFGMSQLDLSLRREFRFTDRHRLQFRVEAFNALNHPNFADPVRYLNSPVFGQSTSMLNLMLGTGSPGSGLAPVLQTGGPRAIQASLRFQF